MWSPFRAAFVWHHYQKACWDSHVLLCAAPAARSNYFHLFTACLDFGRHFGIARSSSFEIIGYECEPIYLQLSISRWFFRYFVRQMQIHVCHAEVSLDFRGDFLMLIQSVWSSPWCLRARKRHRGRNQTVVSLRKAQFWEICWPSAKGCWWDTSCSNQWKRLSLVSDIIVPRGIENRVAISGSSFSLDSSLF